MKGKIGDRLQNKQMSCRGTKGKLGCRGGNYGKNEANNENNNEWDWKANL